MYYINLKPLDSVGVPTQPSGGETDGWWLHFQCFVLNSLSILFDAYSTAG